MFRLEGPSGVTGDTEPDTEPDHNKADPCDAGSSVDSDKTLAAGEIETVAAGAINGSSPDCTSTDRSIAIELADRPVDDKLIFPMISSNTEWDIDIGTVVANLAVSESAPDAPDTAIATDE